MLGVPQAPMGVTPTNTMHMMPRVYAAYRLSDSVVCSLQVVTKTQLTGAEISFEPHLIRPSRVVPNRDDFDLNPIRHNSYTQATGLNMDGLKSP